MNLVDGWFSQLTMRCLRRVVFRSVWELVKSIREYIDVNNRDSTPFRWTKGAREIPPQMEIRKEALESGHQPQWFLQSCPCHPGTRPAAKFDGRNRLNHSHKNDSQRDALAAWDFKRRKLL